MDSVRVSTTDITISSDSGLGREFATVAFWDPIRLGGVLHVMTECGPKKGMAAQLSTRTRAGKRVRVGLDTAHQSPQGRPKLNIPG